MKYSKQIFIFLGIFVILNTLTPFSAFGQTYNTNSYKGLKEYIDDTIPAAIAADAKIKQIYTNSDLTGTTGPNVTLKQGANVTITRAGDTIEISATGGSTGTVSADATVEILADEALSAGDVVFFTDYSGTLKARKSTTVLGTPSILTPSYTQTGGAANFAMSSIKIADNLVFIVFANNAENKLYAAYVIKSGNSAVVSDLITLEDTAIMETDISRISDAEAILIYRNPATGYLKAVKLTYAAGVLSASKGTDLTNYTVDGSTKPAVVNLNTTQSLSMFRNSADSRAYTMLITEDESNFTATSTIAAYDPIDYLDYASDLSKLDSGSAIGIFDGGANTRVIKYNVSGDTLTRGGQLSISGTAYGAVSAGVLNSSQVMLTRASGSVYLVTISGDSLTLTDTDTTLPFSYGEAIITPMYATGGVITHGMTGTSNMKIAPFAIVANNIVILTSLDTGYTATSNMVLNSMSMSMITDTYGLLMFADKNDTNKGKVALYNTGALELIRPKIAGISQTSVSADATATILISGTSTAHTNLIPKMNYYLQSATDLSIGTTPVSILNVNPNNPYLKGEVKVGIAKSATELILGVDYTDGQHRVSEIVINDEITGTTGPSVTLQAGNNISITRMGDIIGISAAGGTSGAAAGAHWPNLINGVEETIEVTYGKNMSAGSFGGVYYDENILKVSDSAIGNINMLNTTVTSAVLLGLYSPNKLATKLLDTDDVLVVNADSSTIKYSIWTQTSVDAFTNRFPNTTLSGATGYVTGIQKIDDDDYVILFTGAGNYVQYQVWTWDSAAGTLTQKISTSTAAANAGGNSMTSAMLDSDDLFIGFYGSDGYMKYTVMRWSGSAFSTIVAFTNIIATQYVDNIAAEVPESPYLLVGYTNGSLAKCYYKVMGWNGSALSEVVAQTEFRSGDITGYLTFTKINNSPDILFTYRRDTNTGRYEIYRYARNGATVSITKVQTETEFSATTITYNFPLLLNDGLTTALFYTYSNQIYYTMKKSDNPIYCYLYPCYIKITGNEGVTAEVQLAGNITTAGLTAYSKYYLTSAFELSTTTAECGLFLENSLNGITGIGYSKSANSLLMIPNFK